MSSANPYRVALAQAEKELSGLDARKKTLIQSISSLRALLGEDDGSNVAQQEESSSGSIAPKIWRRVELWRIESTDPAAPFTVKQALDGTAKMGWPIDSKNDFQIMRQALKKKGDLFRHDPISGTYQLIPASH